MLIPELEEGASLIRSGRGKKKLLIIDDDPLYINIYKKILTLLEQE